MPLLGRDLGCCTRVEGRHADVVDGDLGIVLLAPLLDVLALNHVSKAGTKWFHCRIFNVFAADAGRVTTNGPRPRASPVAAAAALTTRRREIDRLILMLSAIDVFSSLDGPPGRCAVLGWTRMTVDPPEVEACRRGSMPGATRQILGRPDGGANKIRKMIFAWIVPLCAGGSRRRSRGDAPDARAARRSQGCWTAAGDFSYKRPLPRRPGSSVGRATD